MFLDLFVSLILTAAITIVIKIYFGEMTAFPVLTFLVIAILSYIATALVHGLVGAL